MLEKYEDGNWLHGFLGKLSYLDEDDFSTSSNHKMKTIISRQGGGEF